MAPARRSSRFNRPPNKPLQPPSGGDRLPDDCSVEDGLYHLYVLQAVERGQADVAVGRTISHDEVEAALRRKWLRADGT